MKKFNFKNAFIAAGIAVFAGVLTIGVNAAMGVSSPTEIPNNSALVSPTFNGVDVRGGISNSGTENNGNVVIDDNLNVNQGISASKLSVFLEGIAVKSVFATGAVSQFLSGLYIGSDQWLTVDKITSTSPGTGKNIVINSPLKGISELKINDTLLVTEDLWADGGVWTKDYLRADGELEFNGGLMTTLGGNLKIKDKSSSNFLNIANGNITVGVPDGGKANLNLFEGADYGFNFEYDGAGAKDALNLWSRKFSGNEAIRTTWLKNGNVGIGTAAPLSRLDVANGLIKNGKFSSMSSSRGGANSYTNLFLGGSIDYNNDGTYTIRGDGGSNYGAAIKMDNLGGNKGAIKFITRASTSGSDVTNVSEATLNGLTKMAIVEDKVGIGTTTPVYKLDVRGSISGDSLVASTLYGIGGILTIDTLTWFNNMATFAKGAFFRGSSQSSQGKSTVIITQQDGQYRNDWPSTWGGGLATWDIAAASIRYSSLSQRSDARLKRDVKSIDESIIDEMIKLRPVIYKWKDSQNLGNKVHYGFIAQEVEKIFPELIETSEDGSIKSLSYTDFISILVRVSQDQQKEIDQLKAENTEIKVALCEIKADLGICKK